MCGRMAEPGQSRRGSNGGDEGQDHWSAEVAVSIGMLAVGEDRMTVCPYTLGVRGISQLRARIDLHDIILSRRPTI